VLSYGKCLHLQEKAGGKGGVGGGGAKTMKYTENGECCFYSTRK